MLISPVKLFFLGSLLFLLLYLVALEILRLIVFAALKLTKKKLPPFIAKINRFLLPVLAVLAVSTTAVGMHNAVLDPETSHTAMEVPDHVKNFKGLKAVIITDLHVYEGTDENFCEKLKDKINAEQPDVIFVLGDVIDGFVDDLGYKLLPLAELKSRYGTYVVPGNHEYYWNYKNLMKFYTEKLGMTALLNESVFLPDANCVISGITDAAAKRLGGDLPNPEKALEGTPKDALKIVLSHRPGEYEHIAAAGGDVQFSGHTHGGMFFCFNLLVKAYNNGLVCGEYERDGLKIFVCRGVSQWHGFPFRIFCPAEIDVIDFRASKDRR